MTDNKIWYETKVVNGVEKEVKFESYISKSGIPITVEGELNTAVMANKLKQVYEDMEAGRY